MRVGAILQQVKAKVNPVHTPGPSNSARRDRGNPVEHRGQRFRPFEKREILSSLSKTPKEILATEPEARHFPPPRPLATKYQGKNNKFFRFHDEKGHDTNECRELKSTIISAVKAGKLEHLVVGAKNYQKQDENKTQGGDRRRAAELTPPEGTIHMIHSWRAGQRRKAEGLEIWEKQAIIFPPIEDANHQVGRVYVDSGSAIDIMYEHCFL